MLQVNKIKIFTIVVTYNGSKTIFDCLNSLVNSSFPVEIIVVDNASKDNTPSIVNNFKNIIFLPQNNNIGFGQANNLGFKYALKNNASFIFLLNQDAIIETDTIEKLVSVATESPEYGILSPVHLNGEGSKIDDGFLLHINRSDQSFISDLYLDREQSIYKASFINAAAWLISEKCIKDIGGFDSIFFMYGEDIDYCFRAELNSYSVGFVPSTKILHKRSHYHPKSNKEKILLTANVMTSKEFVGLKINKRPFIIQLFVVYFDILSKFLVAIRTKNLIRSLASIISFFKITIRLPKVLVHRNITRRKIPLWE